MHKTLDAIYSKKKRRTLADWLLVGFLALSPLRAVALQRVMLAWDFGPDPTVAGSYVYYGTVSGSCTNKIDSGTATTATLSNLVEGVTYHFAVTTYNSGGLESAPSNKVSYTVPLPPGVTPVASLPNGSVPASYYGLFYESNQVQQSSSGAFVLSTTKQGRYSGYLQIGNTRLPFHGQLDAQGRGTNALVRPDHSTLALQFSLMDGQPADQIQGTVTADTWVADLSADRAVFSAKAHPTALQGAYTLVIPGPGPTDPALPFGHSFGLVHIAAAGQVRLSASLADGTRLTQSAPLSAGGLWGLYAPLYGGHGSLLGWLAFTNRPTDDFHGALSWIKPAHSQARYYPAGFTNDCQACGSAYVSLTETNLLGMSGTHTTLSFAGGDLTAAFTNLLAETTSGHLKNRSTNRLSLSLSRSTGAFRGSVTDPATGTSLPFAGALFQKTQTGHGFLLGHSQSGQVDFSQ